jgi:elongation factor P--(R)-beta-lysine ligase
MSAPQRHDRLRQRAELLARLRKFFHQHGFLEVETPLVDDEIIPELHIEPFPVGDAPAERSFAASADADAPPGRETTPRRGAYLQASPELHMKPLLAEGLPAIYQITRSFRQHERGALHNPEFTIVEWYRTDDDMAAGMSLLSNLLQQVAGASAAAITTYEAAFGRYAGVDPHRASLEEIAGAACRLEIVIPDAMRRDDRDEWLNLLLAAAVEPRLGAAGPEILCDYPASQSALAATRTRADGVEVAERFELYWRSVELANGYCELTDAAVLRSRLEEVNRQRIADNRPPLPLPERLLAAMHSPGLPQCSGCALGFDRLAMLASGASCIAEVMAYSHD